MNLKYTDEQKRHIISILLSAFVSLVVALGVAMGYPVTMMPSTSGEISAQGLAPIRFSNPVVFQRTATFNQATTQTGAFTVAGLINADGGIAVDTSAFTVADASGNTVIAGTLSIGGGYGSTGCTVSAAGALSCNGALIVGNTATFTDTLNMSNAVISNIGNASTDFDLSGGLTVAGGITGTVNTAAQASITSLGTQAATLNMGNNVISNIGNASTDFDTSGGLTAAGGFTGTVNTAAQGSITSLGTQASALNMGNAVINNIGNAGTDFDLSGGLTAAGGFTGTVNTAAQPNITSVGTLPVASITDLTTTNITGTLATAAQPNITSVGTLPTLTVGTLTATTLISQTVGVDFTAASTLVTTTVGSGGVGTLTVHAPAIFTDTVTFAAASIADAALGANVPLLNAANAFTAAQTMVTTTVGTGGVGSLTAHAPVVMTDTLNVTGLTTLGTATATTLQVGGVSFSGALKYGTAATYVAGTGITHGFATTPTVCLLTPMPITGTLTITTTGFSSDTGMTAVPIYWACGQ